MKSEDWQEKRKYARAAVQKLVRYKIVHGERPDKVSRTLRALLTNIGGGGVLLAVKELVTEGLHISFNENVVKQNWLALEMDLFPGRSPVHAMGKVAWYQKSMGRPDYKYDVGVEFKDISEEDRNMILDFVKRSIS